MSGIQAYIEVVREKHMRLAIGKVDRAVLQALLNYIQTNNPDQVYCLIWTHLGISISLPVRNSPRELCVNQGVVENLLDIGLGHLNPC